MLEAGREPRWRQMKIHKTGHRTGDHAACQHGARVAGCRSPMQRPGKQRPPKYGRPMVGEVTQQRVFDIGLPEIQSFFAPIPVAHGIDGRRRTSGFPPAAHHECSGRKKARHGPRRQSPRDGGSKCRCHGHSFTESADGSVGRKRRNPPLLQSRFAAPPLPLCSTSGTDNPASTRYLW